MISVTPKTDVPPKPVMILLAEDEVLVRLMVADALRGEGFPVFEASNGQEGISILKARRIDVVITDLRMDTLTDGLELARYARAQCPDVSLVLASAQAPPIVEDLSFDAFFTKPCPPEDIASWIRRRHTRTSDQ